MYHPYGCSCSHLQKGGPVKKLRTIFPHSLSVYTVAIS
jgi:hypothetical protein